MLTTRLLATSALMLSLSAPALAQSCADQLAELDRYLTSASGTATAAGTTGATTSGGEGYIEESQEMTGAMLDSSRTSGEDANEALMREGDEEIADPVATEEDAREAALGSEQETAEAAPTDIQPPAEGTVAGAESGEGYLEESQEMTGAMIDSSRTSGEDANELVMREGEEVADPVATEEDAREAALGSGEETRAMTGDLPADVTQDEIDQAQQLRDRANEELAAGNEEACLDDVNEAKMVLGIE
jgi:hypothetical protein